MSERTEKKAEQDDEFFQHIFYLEGDEVHFTTTIAKAKQKRRKGTRRKWVKMLGDALLLGSELLEPEPVPISELKVHWPPPHPRPMMVPLRTVCSHCLISMVALLVLIASGLLWPAVVPNLAGGWKLAAVLAPFVPVALAIQGWMRLGLRLEEERAGG